jgi:hypothetical protein
MTGSFSVIFAVRQFSQMFLAFYASTACWCYPIRVSSIT